MDEQVELIRLPGGDGFFAVVVNGRYGPGLLPGHDWLVAELLVELGFVHGRFELILTQADLDDWASVLTRFATGRDVSWLDSGRTPELRLTHVGESYVEVTVEDLAEVRISFRADLPHDWLESHAARLARVRESWPSEVLQSAPGVYEWRQSTVD